MKRAAKEGEIMERMLKQLKNKFFKGQPPNKEMMLILFLSGILIFVILLPVDNGSKNSSSYLKKSTASVSQNNGNAKTNQLSEMEGFLNYRKSIEAELETFLVGVAGVESADALIYMGASWDQKVEKDKNASSDAKSEETVYTVNENGQEVPFVRNLACPKIEGVAVVVKGDIDDATRVMLVRLIMTLYGLPANKVEVIR